MMVSHFHQYFCRLMLLLFIWEVEDIATNRADDYDVDEKGGGEESRLRLENLVQFSLSLWGL